MTNYRTIEKWAHGCRVTVTDWIDDRIHVCVEEYAPGSSISRPLHEYTFLTDGAQWDWIVGGGYEGIAQAVCMGQLEKARVF